MALRRTKFIKLSDATLVWRFIMFLSCVRCSTVRNFQFGLVALKSLKSTYAQTGRKKAHLYRSVLLQISHRTLTCAMKNHQPINQQPTWLCNCANSMRPIVAAALACPPGFPFCIRGIRCARRSTSKLCRRVADSVRKQYGTNVQLSNTEKSK
jgi:hypothetical protein